MTFDRAPAVDPSSKEFVEPCYGGSEADGPMRISLSGPDRFIKDDHGWYHLLKDGREIGSPHFVTCAQIVPLPDATLESVVQIYEERLAQWTASSAVVDTISFFRDTVLQVQGLKLTSCICVGIGTFASDRSRFRGDNSLDQLAAFETLLGIIRKSSKPKNINATKQKFLHSSESPDSPGGVRTKTRDQGRVDPRSYDEPAGL